MSPSFLKLSPVEEDLFLNLIKTHISAALIKDLTDLVIELNEKTISETNTQDQNTLNLQINQIKSITESVIRYYMGKWIMINTNYNNLLADLLKNPQYQSLVYSPSLDHFMQNIVTLDTSLPKEHLVMLTNFSIPAAQRFFNYTVIKMADYLGCRFNDKKYFIAESICKEIYTKVGLNQSNINKTINNYKENINTNPIPIPISTPNPNQNRWKLQWF
jgi:hypothetical protein